MGRRNKKNPKPEEALGYLLYDLCVESGFCNYLTPEDLFAPAGSITAEKFAIAVLEAEDMVPEYEKKFREMIEGEFRNRFGSILHADDPA